MTSRLRCAEHFRLDILRREACRSCRRGPAQFLHRRFGVGDDLPQPSDRSMLQRCVAEPPLVARRESGQSAAARLAARALGPKAFCGRHASPVDLPLARPSDAPRNLAEICALGGGPPSALTRRRARLRHATHCQARRLCGFVSLGLCLSECFFVRVLADTSLSDVTRCPPLFESMCCLQRIMLAANTRHGHALHMEQVLSGGASRMRIGLSGMGFVLCARGFVPLCLTSCPSGSSRFRPTPDQGCAL